MIKTPRSCAALLLLTVLSACAGGSSGIGRLPADVSGALYTDKGIDAVANCLGTVTGGTVQAQGDRRVVTASGASAVNYDIGPNPDNANYPTTVMIHGIEERRATEVAASACGLADPPA